MLLEKLEEKKYTILAVFGIVLILLVIVAVSRRSNQQGQIQIPFTSQSTQSASEGVPVPLPVPSPIVIPAPQIQFSSYKLEALQPTVPETVKIYTFKTDLNENDAKVIASKLGLVSSDAKTKGSHVTISNSNSGYFTFDTTSGGWSYLAGQNGIPITAGTDLRQSAQDFIISQGLADATVTCSSSYRRHAVPNIAYVECHRDWEKIGLPIFNPIGVLNIAPNESLQSLKVGKSSVGAIANPDIYNTIDGTDGKKRPGEFNTFTLGINDLTSTIVLMTTNIRPIKTEEARKASGFVKSPDRVLEDIKAGKASFSQILPLGTGALDVRKLLPKESVVGRDAVITDYIVAYAEMMPDSKQDCMSPQYFVRGKATVSGYPVEFVQVVPAAESAKCSSSVPRLASVKGTSIQYGTFPAQEVVPTDVPEPTSSPQPSSGPSDVILSPVLNPTETPEVTPTPPPSSCPVFTNCVGYEDNSKVCWYPETASASGMRCTTQEIPNKGPFDSGPSSITNCSNVGRNWYYIPPPGAHLQSENNVDEFLRWEKLAKTIYQVGGICPNEAQSCPGTAAGGFQPAECGPIGSHSPRIFVNSTETRTLSIQVLPMNKTSFVYPLFTSDQNKWSGTVNFGNITLTSGESFDSLYYEYYPIDGLIRSNSNTGFVVRRAELLKFVKEKIAPQIGLNQKETESWIEEINRETAHVSSEFVQISFIGKSHLDTYLPLKVNPTPYAVDRIHIRITPVNLSRDLNPPSIPKVHRLPYSVLELGVFVE